MLKRKSTIAIFILSTQFIFQADAAVSSLSRERVSTSSDEGAVRLVTINCSNKKAGYSIQKKPSQNKWCDSSNTSNCRSRKMEIATLLCDSKAISGGGQSIVKTQVKPNGKLRKATLTAKNRMKLKAELLDIQDQQLKIRRRLLNLESQRIQLEKRQIVLK